MDDIRDTSARQGLCRAPAERVFRRLGLDPPAVGRARRPAREHVLPARSRSALKPMYVRPDVEGIVT